MMQFPAIGPAEGHLASVFAEYRAIGPYFGIAPEITANLIDVVEIGSEDFTHIVEPVSGWDLGQRQRDAARATSELEQRPARFARKAFMEGNVASDRRAAAIERELPRRESRQFSTSDRSCDNVDDVIGYAFPRDVVPSALPTMIGEKNAHLLRGTFEGWLPDVPHRQPFVAMVEDGHAVSICASVRISEKVHCGGVETHATYRHRGHAVNVVAGWAIAVRSTGAAPFYSTSWDNIASQRVAARLRLSLVGVYFHVT
jgi:hypothetical protein